MKICLRLAASLLLAGPVFLTAQTEDGADRMSPAALDPAPAPASAAIYIPLTESERVRQYVRDLDNPFSLFTSAVIAGIGQAEDHPHEWHEGAEGFGLRFGSAYAQHIVRETLKFGAGSLLHEDDRYVPSGETGFGRRVKYAVLSTFISRHNDGSRGFAYARVGSYAGAAAISRLWQPPSTHTVGSGFSTFGISIGVAAAFNVFREFRSHRM